MLEKDNSTQRLPWNMYMSKWIYEPTAYWTERGKQYTKKAPLIEYDYFKSTVKEANPPSILEVGSGSGQIHDILAQIGYADRFTGCDFVDSMLKSHFENTGIMPDKWNGKHLSYANDSFSMVVSFYVMLHVPPSDIVLFFSEHVRVARDWLYIVTYAPQKRVPLAPHCFAHDYRLLINTNKLDIIAQKRFGTRVHLLLTKETYE